MILTKMQALKDETKMTYQDMDTAILNCSKFNEDYYYGFGGWSRGDLSHNGKLYFDSIYDFRFAN